MPPLTLASIQYPVAHPEDFDAFAQQASQWVRQAADRGAQLVVLPEYLAMQLTTCLQAPHKVEDPLWQADAIQRFLPDYLALFRSLAQELALYLLAGTFPVLTTSGHWVNRAHLFAPSGQHAHQDKLILTRFEREIWHLHPGDALSVLETELGILAIAICYDSEFPLLVRQAVSHGAQILLTPSCTDTMAGFHRVRLSCRARALENQMIVVQAPLVGLSSHSLTIDENVGFGGIYGPIDRGFPDNGVLAAGALNQAGCVTATVTLADLDTVRTSGQVLNHQHWEESLPFWGKPPQRIQL
jgi:predicted amidohydrolase